jgi:asparagine synthase (glutamine-hydrolysing)
MCGICVQINLNGQQTGVEDVVKMTEAMKARGPDALGMHMQGGAVLGHRRLKIIDLSERAHQPMVENTLGLSIVYNGAIYNCSELRNELEAKGYQFFSILLLRRHRGDIKGLSRLGPRRCEAF